jgi:EmrB/QacA subfamily drug resistance transporter
VSWQSIFFLNVPVAIAAVAVTLFAAHESRDETVARVVDVPGVVTLSVGLAALVLALVEGNSWHWGSVRVVGLLATSVVALGAFVAIEMRSRVPMVDFSFFRSRSFLGANIVAFIVSFAMLAMFFFIALYMQNILGYSPLQAGVRFLPSTAMIIVIGPIAGRLADRVGPRKLIAGGLIAVSASLLWQSRITTHTSYGFLIVAFVLMGVGMGFVMSPMSTAAMNAIDRTKAGVASGILSMSRMVGGTFGVAVMGALVSALGRSHLRTLLPTLSNAQRSRLAEGLGTGGVGLHLPPRIGQALNETFVYALSRGLVVASALALIGALVAVVLVAGRPAPHEAAVTDARGPATAVAQETATAAAQAAAGGAEAPTPGPQPVGA